MKRQVGVGGTVIGPREREYVNDVLDRGRLTYGDYSRRFEAEFASLHQRRFAVFCNSGTSALQVAVHALKKKHAWQDGDEIVIPAITFVATVNVVLQNRLKPVFVDVDPTYYHLDGELVENVIGERTRAIMPVHTFGQPADLDHVMELARLRDLRVIEDSCEAMLVRRNGVPVGGLGDIACYSTYMAHLIVTGVGGFALTDDPDVAVTMRSLCNHGRDGIYLSIDDDRTEDLHQLREVMTRRFNFIDAGYSYRATELEAAIGLAQLERWQQIIGAHQRHAAMLTAGLQPFDDRLQLPNVRPGGEHAYMMFPILVQPPLQREDLTLFLEQRQIETRRMLPLLSQPVYRELFGDLLPRFPVAARIERDGFYIGCHSGLTDMDIEYVVEAFTEYFRTA